MTNFLRSLATSEAGASMVEYALMVALIAASLTGILVFLCINIEVALLKVASVFLGI